MGERRNVVHYHELCMALGNSTILHLIYIQSNLLSVNLFIRLCIVDKCSLHLFPSSVTHALFIYIPCSLHLFPLYLSPFSLFLSQLPARSISIIYYVGRFYLFFLSAHHPLLCLSFPLFLPLTPSISLSRSFSSLSRLLSSVKVMTLTQA
jgi:hypothetical protein